MTQLIVYNVLTYFNPNLSLLKGKLNTIRGTVVKTHFHARVLWYFHLTWNQKLIKELKNKVNLEWRVKVREFRELWGRFLIFKDLIEEESGNFGSYAIWSQIL